MSRLPLVLAVIAIPCLLSGCATDAQRQGQAMRDNYRLTYTALNSCVRGITERDEYAILRRHAPLDINTATLEQQTDTSFISDDEANATFPRHALIMECRESALNQIAVTNPSLIPVMSNGMARADENLIDLITKKETWGEFVVRQKKMTEEFIRNFNAEVRVIDAQLNQSHASEIANRQAAIAAISQLANVAARVTSLAAQQRAPNAQLQQQQEALRARAALDREVKNLNCHMNANGIPCGQ